MRIGYLGPQGTFTHFACLKAIENELLLGGVPVEYQSLDQLFDALPAAKVDAIFTPIENSIEGPVNRVLDALIHTPNASIDTIVNMPINQSLLSFNSTIALTEISHIISMPHAIAQCYSFIKTHCPSAVLHHAPSTAGSVPMIDALSLPKDTSVVIGHAGISDFFPIHVIEKNIHDQKQNMTQFCLIQHATSPDDYHEASNCMLAFSTPKDAPGSLLDVLSIFKSHNINLTKILSRPEKSSLGSYIFFVEFSIHPMGISLHDLFNQVKEKCLFFKSLGIYNSEVVND